MFLDVHVRGDLGNTAEGLGTQPRASHMLGKQFTMELPVLSPKYVLSLELNLVSRDAICTVWLEE